MDATIRGWIEDILNQRGDLLAIAIRQRAKFEGWLKFELAAYAARHGATQVQVEASYAKTAIDLSRSDVSFSFGGERYDVELKTPNTNWRLPGVTNATRPITQNIAEIVEDGRKLAGCAGRGIVAIVMFPIPPGGRQWTVYLERIATGLSTPLSGPEHATQLAVPLGDGFTADVVVCCFPVPRREDEDGGPGLRPIPGHWLVHKIGKSSRTFATAVEQLRPMMREGDELWFYDEPAPSGVNAGELGVALVRDGSAIHAIIEGIH